MIARSLVYSDGEKVSFSGNLIWCGKQTINNVVGNFKNEYHSHPRDSLCKSVVKWPHLLKPGTRDTSEHAKGIKQTKRAIDKDFHSISCRVLRLQGGIPGSSGVPGF